MLRKQQAMAQIAVKSTEAGQKAIRMQVLLNNTLIFYCVTPELHWPFLLNGQTMIAWATLVLMF